MSQIITIILEDFIIEVARLRGSDLIYFCFGFACLLTSISVILVILLSGVRYIIDEFKERHISKQNAKRGKHE